jgi:hypothetical protein
MVQLVIKVLAVLVVVVDQVVHLELELLQVYLQVLAVHTVVVVVVPAADIPVLWEVATAVQVLYNSLTHRQLHRQLI